MTCTERREKLVLALIARFAANWWTQAAGTEGGRRARTGAGKKGGLGGREGRRPAQGLREGGRERRGQEGREKGMAAVAGAELEGWAFPAFLATFFFSSLVFFSRSPLLLYVFMCFLFLSLPAIVLFLICHFHLPPPPTPPNSPLGTTVILGPRERRWFVPFWE